MSAAILVVEDEHSLANLLKERFSDEGYQVRIAYTGAEAVKELKGTNPDVITLDIYLPDANGLNILQELKADPLTNKIPVIIISSSDERQRAKKCGAEEFVSKPVDFKKLFALIENIKAKQEVQRPSEI